MGTTLTGTTPQDTYDSLIKVTDNGPLSGTLKTLTDGLGNDSALALSTGAASVTGNLTASGAGSAFTGGALEIQGSANAIKTFYINRYGVASGSQHRLRAQNAYFEIASANSEPIVLTGGNVGIGTSSPVARLDAVAAVTGTYTTSTQQVVQRIYNNPSDLGSGVNSAFISLQTTTDAGNANPIARIGVVAESYGSNNGAFVVTTREAAGNIEKMRVTSDGYLRLATGGIQFNGDTAAANALDDYEEGTWTPAFTMGTSGTVTMGDVLGRYTKIGNVVTCTGYANAASVSSPVGELRITGLPFTVGSGNDSAITLFAYGFANTTSVTAYQGFTAGSVNYAFVRGFNNGDQVQNIGANVTGGAGLIFTITYRV